jgi:hypothetical protein
MGLFEIRLLLQEIKSKSKNLEISSLIDQALMIISNMTDSVELSSMNYDYLDRYFQTLKEDIQDIEYQLSVLTRKGS